MTPYVLLAAAFLLAWPVPVLLGRATWVTRTPGLAMLLWQAVALAGGLTMIGAPLLWGMAPFGEGLLSASSELAEHVRDIGWSSFSASGRWPVERVSAVVIGLVLASHLLLTLLDSTVRTLRQRTRHRRTIELLTQPSTHSPTGEGITAAPPHTRVLPYDHPLAYCLPGLTGSVTIISRGLIERLSPPQINAVIAHERAHLRQRHDLLRLAFEAWNRACSWLPTTDIARSAVTELTEMLADDVALRQHDRRDLIRAVALVASADSIDPASLSTGPPPATGPLLLGTPGIRMSRLLTPPARLNPLATALVVVVTVALVALPVYAILFG